MVAANRGGIEAADLPADRDFSLTRLSGRLYRF
jgi:hypothetical protein